MSDVIFIATLIAFFVLCALYVHVCDRMIGPDELTAAGNGAGSPLDGESATMITSSTGTSDGVTA